MAIKTDAIGKEWPATTYEVGKEKIGEYARVVGLDNPVHSDREAARAAGYATPSTFRANGKQYVVIAAGGGKLGTPSGDSYVAFALPD